jgi:enterochelin esterase-like enzyme
MRRSLFVSAVGFFVALALGAGVVVAAGGSRGDVGPAQEDAAVLSGSRVESRSFFSPSLGRAMPFLIFLPPGYDSNAYARFPVLYMLHGLGGNENDWAADGLFDTARDLIDRGEIPRMIIVTPAGDRGYWMDHANKGPGFGTYVSRDLVSLVDGEYRTLPLGAFRAIGGMSMGGHGALQLALNNPGEFGVVGAHSVALRRKDQAFDFFGDKQYFEAHDPASLFQKSPTLAGGLVIWLDIGRSDGWFSAANAFHGQLQSQRIAHVWNAYEGGHDPTYWSSHVADYLRFYGRAFEQANVTDPLS